MKKLMILFVILLSITLYSCIPSQPEPPKKPEEVTTDTGSMPIPSTQNPPNPTPTPDTEKKSETTTAPPASTPSSTNAKKSQTTMRFGVQGSGFPFSIQQTPLANEEGFSIKGSFGLSGTLTRPDKTKDLWVFAGQFELPSKDYEIGEITYNIINAPLEYYTEKKPLPPSFIPQVMVTIPVKLPPNAKDEKGEVKIPFRLEIPVSANAQFLFTMIDKL